MIWDSYKKKCSKCGYINDIPAEWFNNQLENKEYTCPSCSHSVLLKASVIRNKVYNNFLESTQLVGSNAKSNYSLKVTHQGDRGFYDISDNIETIQIKRGNTLSFLPDEGEKNYTLKIPDIYLSKNHATINVMRRAGNKTLVLKDNKSTNGTICNQTLLEESDEIILQNNDIIKIGESTIEIIY